MTYTGLICDFLLFVFDFRKKLKIKALKFQVEKIKTSFIKKSEIFQYSKMVYSRWTLFIRRHCKITAHTFCVANAHSKTTLHHLCRNMIQKNNPWLGLPLRAPNGLCVSNTLKDWQTLDFAFFWATISHFEVYLLVFIKRSWFQSNQDGNLVLVRKMQTSKSNVRILHTYNLFGWP